MNKRGLSHSVNWLQRPGTLLGVANYKGRIVSSLIDELNTIIATHEKYRNLEMPRIGEGHAECYGGIFSLLQNPANSGAAKSKLVSVYNKDPTAEWCRKTFEKLSIDLAYVIPWNAVASFGELTNIRAVINNLPLCQHLVNAAKPVAIVAQGKLAHEMANLLAYDGKIFPAPHPSRRGKASYKKWHKKDPDEAIEVAFTKAKALLIDSNNSS